MNWPQLIWPAVIMAVGTVLAFVSAPIGAAVILIGYVWATARSLPAALAVYAICAPFPLGLTFHHHHLNLSDLMAIIMAGRLLWNTVRSPGQSLWDRFVKSPFWRPLVLLMVLSILSLATALSHSTTVIKILEYIEFFIVVVAVARQADLDESAWKPVLIALFGIASLLSLYGFYQFLFQVGPHANVVDTYHVRADAVFGQPNAFGGFEAMVFPIIAALLAYGPKWAKTWWTWVALALVALGVIDSFSRGAWVASMAAVFFMGVLAWTSRGRTSINRKFVVPAVVIPIIGFIIVDLLGKTNLSHVAVHTYQTTGERLSSTVGALVHPQHHFDTNQRLLIWKAALHAIKSHPILGVGLGGFTRFVALHPVKGLVGLPPMAHDLYLEWGADLGVLGIVAAIWLEWSWIKHAVSAVMSKARTLSPFQYAMGLGAFGTMVSFIVHDWVDFMIDHGVIVPLLLALAVVWSLTERRREQE